eukprot:TRINITY_DN44317_c0_g1_i1.p1 TRINITY_DN44317_c0_g1~~TRINITY_DN44317_c0_g1_i1.p1  ORF type:complete len:657 (-),score=87.81 TRINITY_DN44317_c0_g1_i1:508-2478(-)
MGIIDPLGLPTGVPFVTCQQMSFWYSWRCLLAVTLIQLGRAASCGGERGTEDSLVCQAQRSPLVDVAQRIQATRESLFTKLQTLDNFATLRKRLLSGERFQLLGLERDHLSTGGQHSIEEASYDWKHRPLSTNLTRHFDFIKLVAADSEVLFHAFVRLKPAIRVNHESLLVAVDAASTLSLYTLEGQTLISKVDLGHGEGRRIVACALSPSSENRFILTADDRGLIRAHTLRVLKRQVRAHAQRRPSDVFHDTDSSGSSAAQMSQSFGDDGLEDNGRTEAAIDTAEGADTTVDEEKSVQREEEARSFLTATASFSIGFALPTGTDKSVETRRVSAALIVSDGSRTYIVVGDSRGDVTVFSSIGTVKARVKVTKDIGGVLGLSRGQRQTVLFHSSKSFGLFSLSTFELLFTPCSGWTSPIFDVSIDSGSVISNIVVSLLDGNILLFSALSETALMCRTVLKFPRVSRLPFQVKLFHGYAIGLQTLSRQHDERDHTRLRELFFFNLGAMRKGYGDVQSRVISVQVSFQKKAFEHFEVLPSLVGDADRSNARLAFRLSGGLGVEVYNVSVKMLPAGKVVLAAQKRTRWSRQVWVALAVVLLMVAFASWKLYKRWRQRRDGQSQQPTAESSSTEEKAQGESSDGEGVGSGVKIEEVLKDD